MAGKCVDRRCGVCWPAGIKDRGQCRWGMEDSGPKIQRNIGGCKEGTGKVEQAWRLQPQGQGSSGFPQQQLWLFRLVNTPKMNPQV